MRFAEANPGCTVVRYEALVHAPEAALAELLAFLGADHDPAVLKAR